jgi:hypothetical protein
MHEPTADAKPALTTIWPFADAFAHQAPVAWLSPVELARAGVKAAVSKSFGDYVDRRELLGSRLPPSDSSSPLAAIGVTELPAASHTDEYWFDFVADIGDGFTATYAIAERLAQPELTFGDAGQVGEYGIEDGVTPVDEPGPLPAGQLLIMGGDQVYPAPVRTVAHDAYWDRTVGPYELACAEVAKALGREYERGQRTVLAIPGNHDWYDGLVSFLGRFCSPDNRDIGVWRTDQHRSYFAARLPHRWWIWGIDIAFEGPMDQPQMQYFKDVALHVADNESVILCSAKPAWLAATDEDNGPRYLLVQRFLDEIDATRSAHTTPLPILHVPVMLSGDEHFYARHAHCESGRSDMTLAKVVSGGGGASLSTTQRVPDSFSIAERSGASRNAFPAEHTRVWPSKRRSRWALSALGFVRIPKTPSFCALLAGLYLILCSVIRRAIGTDHHYSSLGELIDRQGTQGFGSVARDVAFAAAQSPAFWILFVAIFGALYGVASKGKVPGAWAPLVALAHVLVHFAGVLLLMTGAIYLARHDPKPAGTAALAIALVVIVVTIVAMRHEIRSLLVPIVICAAWVGAVVAGAIVWGVGTADADHVTAYLYLLVVGSYVLATFLFSLYLFSVQFAKWNTTELAAGLRHSGWKEFMRVRVTEQSLTFYALGLRRVPRRWVKWPHDNKKSVELKGSVGALRLLDTFRVERSGGTAQRSAASESGPEHRTGAATPAAPGSAPGR